MNTAVIRRIAVVGPECSGKTTAVVAIADWLRAAGQVVAVVPEAGRIYAEALPVDHVWTMADEVEVARLHLRLVADALAELSGAESAAAGIAAAELGGPESAAAETAPAELGGAGIAGAARFVVSDGTALTPRAWALRAFGEESPELAALDDTGAADLIFLAKPDLPWHPDPLRTSPENRPIEYAIYLDLLAKSGWAFTTLEGHGPARLAPVHQSLQTMLASKAVV
jgi:nicotinamide riboside kinase